LPNTYKGGAGVGKRTRVRGGRQPPPPEPNPLATNGGAIWLGCSPTPAELERMPGACFRAAIDKLLADTVPQSYWAKVVARRQAEAWDVR
jgi:hypothetical protein